MLAPFGFGIVIALIVAFTSLLMTKREEPTGCIIFFGSIFLFALLALLVVPPIVLAK